MQYLLPDEMFIKVLGHLLVRDLGAFAMTCRRGARLGADRQLWAGLYDNFFRGRGAREGRDRVFVEIDEKNVWEYIRRYRPSTRVSVISNGIFRIIPRYVSDLQSLHPRQKFVRVLYWLYNVELRKNFWRARIPVLRFEKMVARLQETGYLRECDTKRFCSRQKIYGFSGSIGRE